MQFRLMTLMLLMSAISVGLALLFVAPRVVSIPVLTGMLWVSPSFWIAGVTYARGNRQAFFLGGMVAGAVPFWAACWFSMSLAVQWMSAIANSAERGLDGPLFADNSSAVYVGLLLLSPLMFSLVGGAVAVLVRIISLPEKRKLAIQNIPPRPKLHALDEDPKVEYTVRTMRSADLPDDNEPLPPPRASDAL